MLDSENQKQSLTDAFEQMSFTDAFDAFQECLGILENFRKFTGKYLCLSLCFNKIAGLQLGILYKADPDPDSVLQKKGTPDLQKKRTLQQNLLYQLKDHFRQV